MGEYIPDISDFQQHREDFIIFYLFFTGIFDRSEIFLKKSHFFTKKSWKKVDYGVQ